MSEERSGKQSLELRRLPKWDTLPEGAILLSEQEVLMKQYDRIARWKPKSEVWPFTYGFGLLGGLAGATSLSLTRHYRHQFGLKSFGRLGTYGPALVVPTLLAVLVHPLAISREILVGKLKCPLCISTRSGTVQMAIGGIYPLLLVPTMVVAQAKKFYTYNVPPLSKHKDVFHMIRSTAPVSSALVLLLLSNFVLGMFIASKEGETFLKVLCKEDIRAREDQSEDIFE